MTSGTRRREGRAALLAMGSSVFVIVFGAFVGVSGGEAGSRPFTPAADDMVVAHVPSRASDPMAREMAALAQVLAREPRDTASATRLARLGIEAARRRADPRFLGR